jgi:hypothetical protein
MADDLPWLSLSEAASRSGLHREALRARAKRGHLPSRRGNLGQVLVQLPPELLTSAQGVTQDSAQGRVEHLAEVVHDLEQELSEARERLAKAEAKVEAVTALAQVEVEAARRIAAAEVAALRQQYVTEVAAKDVLIGALRTLLADARKGWLDRLLEALRRRN